MPRLKSGRIYKDRPDGDPHSIEAIYHDIRDDKINQIMQGLRINSLPDTMPEREIKLALLMAGNICVTDKSPQPGLYAYTGGLGGEPDVYYEPTLYTISNPAQNYSASLEIGTECVRVRCDTLGRGVLPLLNRYCWLLANSIKTMEVCDINSRIVSLISAGDDQTMQAAKEYLAAVKRGDLAIAGSNALLDSLKVLPYATAATANAKQANIEYHNYLDARLWQHLGLSAAHDNKREYVNSDQVNAGDETLLPAIDDMLDCWREGFEQVNKMYGTHITVSKGKAWQIIEREVTTNETVPSDDTAGGDTEPHPGDTVANDGQPDG